MKLKTYATVEHAGTGYRMPEDVARAIDEMAKELPKDFKYKRLAPGTVSDEVLPDTRCEVSIITTDSVDRDGEVVIPKGINWDRYNKSVFLNHDYAQPVGSCQWMKATGDGRGIKAKTNYPGKPDDWGDAAWLPSAVWHFINQPTPILRDKSIGFLPLNIREATSEEKSLRPEWKGRPIIDKAAGLEYSVVSIGCNPDCQVEAVAKALNIARETGVIDEAFAEMVEKSFAAQGVTLKEAPAAVEPPQQNAPAEVEIVHPFVRPETISKAIARRMPSKEAVAKMVDAAVADLLDTAYGRA